MVNMINKCTINKCKSFENINPEIELFYATLLFFIQSIFNVDKIKNLEVIYSLFIFKNNMNKLYHCITMTNLLFSLCGNYFLTSKKFPGT